MARRSLTTPVGLQDPVASTRGGVRLILGRVDEVGEEEGVGDGTDTARDRGDRGGDLAG